MRDPEIGIRVSKSVPKVKEIEHRLTNITDRTLDVVLSRIKVFRSQ